MYKQHPTILFIGDEERADEFKTQADDLQWLLFNPTEVLEALGMYTFYFPDVIVIDSASEIAAESFMHLASVNAENIIVLTDDVSGWDGALRLPQDASIATVIDVIRTPEMYSTVA